MPTQLHIGERVERFYTQYIPRQLMLAQKLEIGLAQPIILSTVTRVHLLQESIQHCFLECKYIQIIWQSSLLFFNTTTLSPCKNLFGYSDKIPQHLISCGNYEVYLGSKV